MIASGHTFFKIHKKDLIRNPVVLKPCIKLSKVSDIVSTIITPVYTRKLKLSASELNTMIKLKMGFNVSKIVTGSMKKSNFLLIFMNSLRTYANWIKENMIVDIA